jgi:6-phosphogluconolactonase
MMKVGNWSLWKACLRVAPAIMGVGMAAMTGMTPQKALAAGGAQSSYFVYVGTYTGHNSTSKGIYQYRFDEKTGSLTSIGLAAEVGSPSFLATDPQHRYLYAVTEGASPVSRGGAVSSFSIDSKTGALTFLNAMPAGGRGPAHLTLDKTGKILFVANYGDGSVASFAIKDDGSIGAMTAVDKHQGSSIDPARQKGPHAHMAVVSPDNRFLFTPDLGLDKIYIYKIDLAKQSITPNDPAFATVKPGLGPRHFDFGVGAKFAYAVCEMGSSVVAFSYDAAKGSLTPIQTSSMLPPDFKGADQGSEIVVGRSGRYLYASNQGPEGNSDAVDGRITVFQIDGKTGLVKPVQYVPSGGKEVRSFAIDPSGKYLLAGNGDSSTVTEFSIASNGQLAPTKQVVEVGSPASLLFVPAP